MPEQVNKTPCCTALLAHVDAGKTTLSEALLYLSGARRRLGRVDHADAFLDSHALERARGITIFSKQAVFSTPSREITLMDTPGHADFAPEAERVMPVLDCAVLVISGTDGVQAHTLTLWQLLERFQVPVFLFINKMDLPGADRAALLTQLQTQLAPGCADFQAAPETIAENAALCDESLLEAFLETGQVSRESLQKLVAQRKLFPCIFGSALHLQGVADLLAVLDRYAPEPVYPAAFAARVYKISRDGSRLTWLKVTGGSLKVRSPLTYKNKDGQLREEKPLQLRRYSGEKFTQAEEIFAGELAAVTGLTETYAGQGLGAETRDAAWVMEPVMTYRVNLPAGTDPVQALPRLRQLEEEEPQLKLLWQKEQLHVQIMGQVQLEVLRALARERLDLEITLDEPRIFYKETIADTVEGVGHFEPLRHYAEVHLLLSPLPQGSGLVFDTVCPRDVLEENYQNLILTHLGEKTHLGVLTGAPITDLKITLLAGKAHQKHTEGGDFRQATYRAVRQGLMQARSVLLEPWYAFTLTMPPEQIGRAITDIRAMSGSFDPPQTQGAVSTLRGVVPAARVGSYPQTLAAYTQGRGRMQLSFRGYAPCHDPETVIREMGYDPEADVENTPDSVFCAHGGGFTVKWDQVASYMHLESGRKAEKPPVILTRNLQAEERELEKIMEREFGPIRRPQYGAKAREHPATEEISIRPPKETYLLVDGYNIIFAWEDLADQAKGDLDAARRRLCDWLSSYAGFTKRNVVVVFDGYKRKGSPGEKTRFHNIQVVYTREGETADAYLEALADRIGSSYWVKVATSDALVQLSAFRSGVLRMSARELRRELEDTRKEMEAHLGR